MKAVLIRSHGGPEVLEVAEVPKPRAGPGQVVVQVKATGINHLDTWVRRGLPGRSIPLPRILGSDAAGIVAEVGTGVDGLAAGDRVFVAPGYSCGRCLPCLSGRDPLCKDYGIFGEHVQGLQAEFVAVPAQSVLPVPAGLSFEEAGSFALVFLTAWHMVVARAGTTLGDHVLVHAGGSGVGSAAIQIAKLLGARVIATVGTDEKAAKVKALGADEVINHRAVDFLEAVRRLTGKRGVDVVVESVGRETWDRSLRSLTRGGRLVTCGATSGHEVPTDLRYIFFKGLTVLGSTMGSRAELLQIVRLMAERRLRPVVDRILPLGSVALGHRAMADRSLFGKIVLTP